MKNVGTLIEMLKRGDQFEDRFENPYLQEALEYEGLLFTASEIKEKFPSIFEDNSRPIVVEVGSYLGKNLLEMSGDCPELNFIGLEITYKRAVTCARKIKNAGLKNSRVSLCDAKDFLVNIPDHSLQGLCLFFPDPWPKKRHAKNRLAHGDFFARLRQKIVSGGFMWFKTDSESYFIEACEAAAAAEWEVVQDEQPSLLSLRSYCTQFELLFIGKNLPIYKRVFIAP